MNVTPEMVERAFQAWIDAAPEAGTDSVVSDRVRERGLPRMRAALSAVLDSFPAEICSAVSGSICGATHPVIDGGMPYIKSAAAHSYHLTARGFWWTGEESEGGRSNG